MRNTTIVIPDRIHIDFHSHGEDGLIGAIVQKLDRLIELVEHVIEKENTMSVQLDQLTEQVRLNTDAEASAILLLQSLSSQIAAIKTDPVALQTLSDELKASADALGAAVVQNTPAEVEPEV